jgi:N6-L-threonylcarbamoyladenine synthase
MIVLGIETSCDDTSAAVFDGRLRSNVISTQLVHRNFGGVVPELASRSHIRLILPVIRQALESADVVQREIEGIAVTHGPGLAGSLLVGIAVAKGIALAQNIPIAGVNHLEGHIWANRLSHPDLDPPFVALLVSGGHTQLVLVSDWGEYRVMGRTRDDAAGEAFDKVAKLLGLGFPGGPAIEQTAMTGNPKAVRFPRAFLGDGSLDFSFSGIKTAVANHVIRIGAEAARENLSDITAGFQSAVVDVLASKSILAAKEAKLDKLAVAGGVALNKALQKRLVELGDEAGVHVYWPENAFCSDNAAMIAAAGHHRLSRGIHSPLDLAPEPSLNL